MYAALFLAAGSGLLGLTYGLVASSLPGSSQPARSAAAESNPQRAKLEIACRQPHPDVGTIGLCKAFSAGERAGSVSQRQRALHNLLLFSLIGLGAMTGLSSVLGWVVAGRVLRPVRAITETARRASQQHLGERIALAGPRDELRELADTFDAMLERLDHAFAAQRRFVANASHELRTPLTMMRTAIDVTLAKPSRTPDQLEDMAVRVRRTIGRAEDMIGALLTLASTDEGLATDEFVDLATVAEDALDVAAVRIGQLGLRIEARLDPAETSGDPHLLDRLIWNLIDNAVRYNEPAGWIRLHTSSAAGAAIFEIANSGEVVPDDALTTIFEPFRRIAGRTVSEGTGLGLSIAESIAAVHGATVTARSQPDGGLRISVRLPRRSAVLSASRPA
jgi:signal transduction histidine kinase